MDQPSVVVVGAGERRRRLRAALADAGGDVVATGADDLDGPLASGPDCVVCLGGGERPALAALAAVRERSPAVPSVVVDPVADVTGERTVVADDLEEAVDTVEQMVAGGSTPAADGTARRPTDDRGRRLRRLLEATGELVGAEDVERVCEVAVDAAEAVLGLPAAGIHMVDGPTVPTADPGAGDGSGQRLVPVAASRGARELFGGDPPTYTPGDGLVWGVFVDKETVAIDDLRDHDRESPARSVLVLPLGDHGVLISSSPDPAAFDGATVDLGQLLATTTTAALNAAKQHIARREREHELRAERDRLSALFENVPIPAVHVDHRDRVPIVVDVNRAFEETFGYDAKSVVDEDIDEYVLPAEEARAESSVSSEAADGRVVSREVRRRTADGIREFLLTVAPVEPGVDDGHAYGFYIDITERKRRQQRLRVLSRVLRHDLRNQVTLIQGAAEVVADRAGESDVRDAAADIQVAADELAAIGRKTRVVGRALVGADTGGVAPLRQVVEGAVAPFRERLSDAALTVNVPDDARIASAEALGLALRELVDNAVTHAGDARPRVEVGGRTDGGFLVLWVHDDGPGIPADERAVLSGDREPSQLEHASGLGLWTVRWVVVALGGEFDIVDSGDPGTRVELRVPLAES